MSVLFKFDGELLAAEPPPPRVTVHPARAPGPPPTPPTLLHSLHATRIAFCGEIYIEFRAIILVGSWLVCLKKKIIKDRRQRC